MRDNIIILHAERVEYQRKGADGVPTGELVQSCRIAYISDEPQNDSRYKGFTVSEGTGPIDMFDSLDLLPGIYEAKFRKTSVRDRYNNTRVGLEPVEVELVGDPGLTFEPTAVKS
ncbi:hypothetical protein [Rubrobacter indicoceani]|uniref:hypothetical protein n=1 Tax=Rubrobacter indicoceani TaxID=2051957 RepID=UPI000E5A821A|nr:hypothetical protein [Rubrobacter indicoceani]